MFKRGIESLMDVVRTEPSVSGTAEVYGGSNFDAKEFSPGLKNNNNPESADSQKFMGPGRSTGSGKGSHGHRQNKNPYSIPITGNPISSNGVVDKLRPSFEFYVRSEEGISLVVDLNSSPSDWVKKLNGGVFVHSNDLNNMLQAPPHELRDLESDDPEANASSRDDTMADCTNNGNLTFANSVLDSTDISSRSTAVTQTNTPVIMPGLIGEQNQLHSSLCEANFDIQNPTNMHTNGSPQTSDEHTLASQIKATSNHVVDSKSDGPKSIDSLEHQSKSVDTNLENIETGSVGIPRLSGGRRPSLASEILETLKPFTGKGSGSCRGFSTSGNLMELHLSETERFCEDMSNSSRQNGGAPDPDIPTHYLHNEVGKLAKCEFDLNKSLDPLVECPEELLLQQRSSNQTNDAESSECSQSDMKAEEHKRFDNSDSEECQNKRQHSQVDDIDNLARKRSRNAKNSNKESQPRRSMRLVSK